MNDALEEYLKNVLFIIDKLIEREENQLANTDNKDELNIISGKIEGLTIARDIIVSEARHML